MKEINVYTADYSDYDSGSWNGVQEAYSLKPIADSVTTRHGCVATSTGDQGIYGVLQAPDNAEVEESVSGEWCLYIDGNHFTVHDVMAGVVAMTYGSEYRFNKIK